MWHLVLWQGIEKLFEDLSPSGGDKNPDVWIFLKPPHYPSWNCFHLHHQKNHKSFELEFDVYLKIRHSTKSQDANVVYNIVLIRGTHWGDCFLTVCMQYFWSSSKLQQSHWCQCSVMSRCLLDAFFLCAKIWFDLVQWSVPQSRATIDVPLHLCFVLVRSFCWTDDLNIGRVQT